jgi:hypothetical protein
MKDTISGYTEIESVNFTFSLSEFILVLIPTEGQIPNSFINKKSKISRLEGITTAGVRIWFFNLSLFGGFTDQSFVTSIPAYILETRNIDALDTLAFSTITFYGEIVDKYFNPSAKFDHINSKVDYETGSSVRVLKPYSEVDVHYSLFSNMELMFGIEDPSLPTQFTHSLGELRSFLRISSNQSLGIDSILDLYRRVVRMFAFFNFRNNVSFERIALSSWTPQGYLECVGTLHIAVEFPRTKTSVLHTIIHSDLKEYIVNLYYQLGSLKQHLCFIPDNDDSSRVLDHNAYMVTCAVFEKVFSLSYPKAILKNTSPVHLEVRSRILASIQEIISTSYGDYQIEANNFLSAVEHMGEKSLRDRFTYCLMQNRAIIEKVFPSVELTDNAISALSSGFVKQRNAFDHGNFERVPILYVSPYSYAVCLIYIMILRLSLVDDTVITNIVKKMFWHFEHKDINSTNRQLS